MRTSEVYNREPGTIADARLRTAGFLKDVGERTGAPLPDKLVGTAQLIVSELVTNASRHTAGPYGLDLEVTGGAVEITVWDTSPGPVIISAPDPTRIGRHGLEIVTALSDKVEVTRADGGKRVTALLSLPEA